MPPRSRSSAPATYRAGVGLRTRRPLRQGAAPPLPPTNLLADQGGSAATSAPSICHPRKARPEPTVAGPPTAADPVGGLASLLSGDRRHERVPGCRVARSCAGTGTLTSGQALRK